MEQQSNNNNSVETHESGKSILIKLALGFGTIIGFIVVVRFVFFG